MPSFAYKHFVRLDPALLHLSIFVGRKSHWPCCRQPGLTVFQTTIIRFLYDQDASDHALVRSKGPGFTIRYQTGGLHGRGHSPAPSAERTGLDGGRNSGTKKNHQRRRFGLGRCGKRSRPRKHQDPICGIRAKHRQLPDNAPKPSALRRADGNLQFHARTGLDPNRSVLRMCGRQPGTSVRDGGHRGL